MLHFQAAVRHLLRPLSTLQPKLSTKTKRQLCGGVLRRRGKHPGGAGRIFHVRCGATGRRAAERRDVSVTWLPALPGNLLFTETAEQNASGKTGRQLHASHRTLQEQKHSICSVQRLCSHGTPETCRFPSTSAQTETFRAETISHKISPPC